MARGCLKCCISSRTFKSPVRQFPASILGFIHSPSLLCEDPLDTVRREASISWLIPPAKQASSNTKHSTPQTVLRYYVWFHLTFPSRSKIREPKAEVYDRERDEMAQEQQHREQRSLSPSMQRWLADTGPFCASVKPKDKEAIALGGPREGKEQDTVDHNGV